MIRRCNCGRMVRDDAPAWYGERPIYAALAIALPLSFCVYLVGRMVDLFA